MCNSDIISLKYHSGDMANSIGHSFFLTFVHCVLGGCLLDQTLLPHSGSLSWLLLGWIIRCPLHPPWLLINSFSIKNQNPWRGVSYHLPFAFTFAPLQKKTTCALTKSVSMDQTIIFHQNYIECGDNWYEAKRKFFCVITFGCNITISVNFHLTQH